jgi:hypothetical protein
VPVLWMLALVALVWLMLATFAGVVVGVFLRRARQIAEVEDFLAAEAETTPAAVIGSAPGRSVRVDGISGRRDQRRWGRPA